MKKLITPALCIFLILLLHSFVRYHGVSIFLAPVSMALLIATAVPLPVFIVGGIIIFLELCSLLPPGSMLLVFSLPFITKSILPWATPDASWKFFAYISGTVCVQIASLMIILFITAHANMYAIPYYIALLQILGTSVGAFMFALVCYETTNRP